MSVSESADDPLAQARPLAERIAAGEAAVFPQLMATLWQPCLRLIAGSRAMRGLAAGEDDVREVATRVMSRLDRDAYRALRLYGPWQSDNPDKVFADWFKILVSNVVRDFAREQRGSAQKREPGELSVKRLLNQFAGTLPLDTLGVRPPMTDAQTANELLRFAQEHLPEQQLDALEHWLRGSSYDDIAAEGGAAEGGVADVADGGEARRLVRAAVATLRRHFVPSR